MLGKYIANVRNTMPMIHCITNYMTMNDVANMILACGGSPMMSSEPEEVEDVTSFCDGFCINIGNSTPKTVEAMLLAGRQSNLLGHIIVLDPGVAESHIVNRGDIALKILENLQIHAICGNVSEVRVLARKSGLLEEDDFVNEEVSDQNLEQAVHFANKFAKKMKCILVMTGTKSLISDGKNCYIVMNGTKEMRKIMSMGCQLSALVTAFLISNPDRQVEAATAAVCTFGYAGEIALGRMEEEDTEEKYKDRIINAVYQMQEPVLDEGERYSVQ